MINELLKECRLCPRQCKADRLSGSAGYCGAGANISAARCALHFWEEPLISGENGSGAVFFSNCPLKCIYCQNEKISAGGYGEQITVRRLAEIFLELQSKGAHNINLVSPTQYAAHIIEAVRIARDKGLLLPIVYNTGGYELADTINMLNNAADIYLTDFKYISSDSAKKYSSAYDYPHYAASSLKAMVKSAGSPVFDKNGVMQSGVIVRHLLLPGLISESKKIVKYLYKTYGDDIYLSLMSQYTPIAGVPKEISARISKEDYGRLIDYAAGLGVKRCFIQEQGSADESYIPEFNLEGVLPDCK